MIQIKAIVSVSDRLRSVQQNNQGTIRRLQKMSPLPQAQEAQAKIAGAQLCAWAMGITGMPVRSAIT